MEVKKYYKKIVVYVVILFTILGLFFALKKYINIKDSSNYIFDGQMNYKVSAKKGKIISDDVSDSSLFISSVVDNILIDFNYKFILNKKINYKYKYEINSYVISYLDDDSLNNNELYRKKEVLVNTNFNDNYSDNFNINNNLSLNYDYYNDIASKYNNSVNVPIKSKLLLELKVFVKLENGQEKEFNNTLSLQLEKNTFSISSTKNKFEGNISSNDINSKILILNILSVIVIVLFIFLIINEVLKFIKYKKEHYLEFKYRKIMRDYDNIVVPINKIPKNDDIVCVKVLYFKSMIDIQHELHIPILCYKSEEFILYMIINNKFAYIYFLNSNREKI